jgi:hypothetical protein
LKTYPMPQQTYTFVPIVEAKKEKDMFAYPVPGPVKKIDLP